MGKVSAPERAPYAQLASRAFLSVCALLFALPLIVCLQLDAGFLDLANEPLAYRFFFSERVFGGEPLVVGVGYLVSLIHHAVYAGLQLLPSIASGSLETRLDLFALVTIGVLTAMMAILCAIAITSRTLRPIDRVLLGLVVLMPIYGTGQMGFDFCLMADYLFLNMILCAATVLVFQLQWARRALAPSRRQVVLAAAFVGLAMANKITMLVVAGVVLVPAIAFPGVGKREFVLRLALAVPALAGAFVLVHVASYLFDLHALVSAVPVWWRFVSNPGGQTEFWERLFREFLETYSYREILLYSIAVMTIAVSSLVRRRSFDLRMSLVSAFCLLGAVASLYFVVKRPAGTTLFESTNFIFLLSSILLTMAAEARFIRILIVLSCVGWGLYWTQTFPLAGNRELVAGSKERSRAKWERFEEVRALAQGRPIEVVLPDNSFHHEGAFELLLKGASDFPTWVITSGQRSVIDRYAPGLSFRHDMGGKAPELPYGGDRAIVWFDRREIPPLTDRYPRLAEAVARPGVTRYEWRVLPKSGQTYLIMHLALLPPGPTPEVPPARNLRADRVGPRGARLSWEPDPGVEYEIEFRAPPSPFRQLGRSQRQRSEYQVGDLAPDVTYEFRLRPVESADPRAWTTTSVPPGER